MSRPQMRFARLDMRILRAEPDVASLLRLRVLDYPPAFPHASCRSLRVIPCDNGGNRDDSASSAVVPEPVAVTPELLAQHSITRGRVRPHSGGTGTRSLAHRTGHLQRDVERALLLQVQPCASEAAAHQERPRGAGAG